MSLGHTHNGNAEAYARAALDRECESASTTGHGRNDQLNRSAFSLGQLVGGGLLGRHEVERRLYAAAEASGYVGKDGPLAARSTIKSGLDKGERDPRTAPANGAAVSLSPAHQPAVRAVALPTPRRPAPVLYGVALPDWTPPDDTGKPTFFGVGVDDPKALDGELRRHTYRRDGLTIRGKVKVATGGFRDFYEVCRPSDGAVGWQARKPEGYVGMPYIGPADAFDPFDPEHLGETLYWPEGEKDVDTLQQAGLVAFTFGGASDVPDCAALLAGRDVVIPVDNDEPGEKCLARKLDAARGSAARVLLHRRSHAALRRRDAFRQAVRLPAGPDRPPMPARAHRRRAHPHPIRDRAMTDILGPATALNAVAVRPSDGRQYGAVDTFFKDCSPASTQDGTQVSAAWLNQVTGALRALARANGLKLDGVTPVVAYDQSNNMPLNAVLQLIQRGQINFVADKGAADAMLATPAVAVDEYLPDMRFLVLKNSGVGANATATPTINFGLGNLTVTKGDGSAISPGDLKKGGIFEVELDSAGNARLTSLVTISDVLALTGIYLGADTSKAANQVVLTSTNYPNALQVGRPFTFKVATGNTGAATIAINGAAAVPLTYRNAQALAAGELVPGDVVICVYDGTRVTIAGAPRVQSLFQKAQNSPGDIIYDVGAAADYQTAYYGTNIGSFTTPSGYSSVMLSCSAFVVGDNSTS